MNNRTCLKATAVLVFLLALVGCEKPAQERTQSSNSAIQVDTLFTKDGCTVYRFEDGGRNRYFARCKNEQTNTSWEEACGKNCTQSVDIPAA